MAKAVDFRVYHPENSRDDLIRRIESAPAEHAEAILAGYNLLQKLHETGMLELASGVLSSGKTIVEHATDVVSSRQAVTALRTILIMGSILNTLDPDELHAAMHPEEKDASILTIARKLTSKESRKAALIGANLLNVFGAALMKQGSQPK